VAAAVSILLAAVVMPLTSYTTVTVAVFGLTVSLVLVFRPKWLWTILLVCLPFSVEVRSALGAGTNLTVPTEALVPLVALTVVVTVLRRGELTWTLSPVHVAAALYLAVQWSSLLHSPLPMVTLKALVRTSSYFLCGYLLTQIAVRRPSDLKPFFILTIGATLVLAAYGFYTQFIEGVSIYQDIAHPFFANHCIYAAWICFPAAFALAACTQPIRYRGWISLFLAVLILAVLLSFVRGAWLGLIALVPYLVHRQRSMLNLRFVLVLGVLILIAVGAVAFLGLGDLFHDRWVNLFDRRYVTNDSRIDRWMAALGMWKSHPFFGVGIGCYPDLYPQFVYYLNAFERNIRMGAHSVYFEILAELGITGLAAYVLIIDCFFRETRRLFDLAGENPNLRAIAIGLEGAMVVYLVHGVVNNLGPSDKIDIAFWATIGLAISLRCHVEKSLLPGEKVEIRPSEFRGLDIKI